jgi:hypothetical protein
MKEVVLTVYRAVLLYEGHSIDSIQAIVLYEGDSIGSI